LPLIESADAGEAIRLNTRAYNVALERMILRHPEQWIWMHRRWKV
jgi:KDO2-lipid IV(A) lauroyltransferase